MVYFKGMIKACLRIHKLNNVGMTPSSTIIIKIMNDMMGSVQQVDSGDNEIIKPHVLEIRDDIGVDAIVCNNWALSHKYLVGGIDLVVI